MMLYPPICCLVLLLANLPKAHVSCKVIVNLVFGRPLSIIQCIAPTLGIQLSCIIVGAMTEMQELEQTCI